MDILSSLVFWAGIFLIVRFNATGSPLWPERARSAKDASSDADGSSELCWIAPARDVDPACGRTVVTARAKSSVYGCNVYYFCSRDCREVFEAAPELYAHTHRSSSFELNISGG